MTNLIIKLFIKNRKGLPESGVRTRFGTIGGACGIAVNILLSAIKAIAGILFGSIALIADSVNNLTDAASSVITLIGFKLAAKKPDSDHPYGHGRLEYISGLIMAFIVLMLGLSLVKSSVQCIFSPEPMVFSWLSVAVIVVSILTKLWLSVFYKKFYKETGSSTFLAASADSRNDCLSTLAVLISIVAYAQFHIYIDGVTGLIVSVIIIVSGVGLIKETLDPLLGQPPEKELINAICEKTLGYPGIIGMHDLVVHNYGPGRIFASLHAEVSASANILESHDIIDNIERDFKTEMGLEVVIHIDPVITDDPEVNALREKIKGIIHGIDPRLAFHDFRMVKGPTHTNLIFDVVLPADFDVSEKEVKAIIDSSLAQTYNTVIMFDRNYIM